MGQRVRPTFDPVRVKLGLMAVGIALVFVGFDRVLQAVEFWVGYGVSVWGGTPIGMFVKATNDQKDSIIRTWVPHLLEPLIGMAVMGLGVWLYRSPAAVRAVLGVERKRA